jgi:hypothetical protein
VTNDQIRIPQVGEIVQVRQRRHLVEQTLSPVKGGDSTLVGLSCVDDDAQGQQLEVFFASGSVVAEALVGGRMA